MDSAVGAPGGLHRGGWRACAAGCLGWAELLQRVFGVGGWEFSADGKRMHLRAQPVAPREPREAAAA
ncbi:MAG: hypothetical protein FJ102_04790 [Deltaproteobacteria bacterium]|nr:hypothetical protein [Deltaproteobacteria bacterium]